MAPRESGVVKDHWQTMTRDSDSLILRGYYSIEHHLSEVSSQFLVNLVGKTKTGIIGMVSRKPSISSCGLRRLFGLYAQC